MKNKILAFILGICLIIPCMLTATACGKTETEPEGPTMETWDGTILEVSEAVDGVVTIETAEELAGFAAAVNAGENYEGITVELTCDMDLANKEWNPISYGSTNVVTEAVNTGAIFKGLFDGKGYTIYNLKQVEFNETGEGNGFFGNIMRAEIKNLTIKGAEVKGHHWVGALVGLARASVIDNCHIENAQVSCVYDDVAEDNGDKAGGLIGYASFSRKVGAQTDSIVKNSSVKNSTVNAVRDAGQLIGCADSGVIKMMQNNTATNVVVTANDSALGTSEEGKKGQNIRNEIYGRFDATTKINWQESQGSIGELPTPTERENGGVTYYTYEISTPEQLAALAKAVNEGNTFATSEFLLTQDIDLGNMEWTPIGYGFGTLKGSNNSGPTFKGVFDGQNNTIYNLKLTTFIGGSNQSPKEQTAEGIGLFGHIYDAVIENLTIYTANVKGNHFVGALVGHAGASRISNCHAINVKVDCTYKTDSASGDKAGALIGCLSNGYSEPDKNINRSSWLINCSVSNCEVKADRDAGRMVGMVTNNTNEGNGSSTVYENLVTDETTTVIYNQTGVGVSDSTGDNITQDAIGRHNPKLQ